MPARTLVVLVTDFEEGGPVEPLLTEVRAVAESGARPLGLAALDDRGQPRYSRAAAEEVAGAAPPVAALSPLELARQVCRRANPLSLPLVPPDLVPVVVEVLPAGPAPPPGGGPGNVLLPYRPA
jgi:VWA domain containing CoxE-like protein